MSLVFHNSEFKEDGHLVSVTDRALRGHGVFDTMLVIDGTLIHGDRHFKRLLHDAEVFGIPFELSLKELTKAAHTIIEKSNANQGRMVLSSWVSMGEGARGLKTPEEPDPQFGMRLSPAPGEFPDLKVIIAQTIRRNEGSPLSQIKSMNYGDNILAYQEAERAGANEAILLNNAGHVTCASTGNVFAVIDGQLITPPLKDGVLAGVTRSILIEKYDVQERSISPEELKRAEATYLTNSLRGAQPVVELEGSALPAPSLLIPHDFHLE